MSPRIKARLRINNTCATVGVVVRGALLGVEQQHARFGRGAGAQQRLGFRFSGLWLRVFGLNPKTTRSGQRASSEAQARSSAASSASTTVRNWPSLTPSAEAALRGSGFRVQRCFGGQRFV